MQSQERVARVRQQCRAWAQKLTDLTKRNRLLFYKPLKKGTLVLSPDAERIAMLLDGEELSIEDLLPEDAFAEEAIARARAIARVALSNHEERGVGTLFLAIDLIRWRAPPDAYDASTPLALLPVSIEQKGAAGKRAVISATGNVLINPVLLSAWQQEFSIAAPPEPDVEATDAARFDGFGDWIAGLEGKVPGLSRRASLTLDNFSFQKMAMVQELTNAADEFVESDLVAALAGVPNALKEPQRAEVGFDEIDRRPPDDDFLVLDADSSQVLVVEHVLQGQSGVIHGPPGTGKSQTIANLIASLAAQGKRVLFVAEKRAALDVVKTRLERVGLGHLILDLHGAEVSRKAIASQLGRALEKVTTAKQTDIEEVHRSFVEARSELVDRRNVLHSPSVKWHQSAYQLIGERLKAAITTRTRFRGAALARFTPDSVRETARELDRCAPFERIICGTETSLWAEAAEVSDTQILEALDELSELQVRLAEHLPALEAAVQTIGYQTPLTMESARLSLALANQVAAVSAHYREEWTAEAEQLARTLSPAKGGWLRTLWSWTTDAVFRAARRRLLEVRSVPASSRQLLADAETLTNAARDWAAFSSVPVPREASPLAPIAAWLADMTPRIERIHRVIPKPWQQIALAELERAVELLLGHDAVARRIPAGRKARASLIARGLGAFLEEMKRDGVAQHRWSLAFEASWIASALDELGIAEPSLFAVDRSQLDSTLATFRQTDRERIQLTAARVMRGHAERTIARFNEQTADHQLLKKESSKKARHMPFRELLGQTGPTLTTLCPCVMASPLSVSQLLPARSDLFDVVIFDEASQVQPEDAAPALLRAKQVVVAGDPKQLPPTAFFATEFEDDETNALIGLESVLDALLTVLPSWKLAWHYRSHDERLIAYSNFAIYKNLITFPGTNREPPLVFEEIPFVALAGQEDSSGEEVRRVVECVLEHARTRSKQSLGVITLGIKHRDRIQHALDAALAQDHSAAEFFDVKRPERFFVKNLEQVQGDERDVIFLSLGYCKSSDGRLPYRFGPILQTGGERRLNVATTRAKHRMVVFSCFSHLDMDPKRSSSEGVNFLRGFLEFVRSGGRVLGGATPAAVDVNAFEDDVRLALESRGVRVVPQHGVSSYRLDFAVQHPAQDGRFVLAIECDGASYHSAPLARDRDRLRQQQLEALGWKVHRIWSTDWFQHRSTELERAVQAVQDAIVESDSRDAQDEDARGDGHTEHNFSLLEDDASRTDRGAKPFVPANPKIEGLPERTIGAMVQWVKGDGRLRTDEELTAEVAHELGFQRLGPRIKERIASAIRGGSN